MTTIQQLKNKFKDQGVRFPIYLDYQSTTPCDPRALDQMLPYFTHKFGNSNSNHVFGWEADAAIEIAREKVAHLIDADVSTIIFTSSATEANNLILYGLLAPGDHVITLQTEHRSIIEPLKDLERHGVHVTYLSVTSSGIVDLDLLTQAITKGTKLVSVMAVHNEIGVIQPLEEIGKICKKHGALFHSDISQGFGKIPINVHKCNIDLASISGHKIYGPKGIGALYLKKGLKPHPLFRGGGQEHGMRSGTLPTPLIVGLGAAASIAATEMQKDYDHIKTLYDYFMHEIAAIQNIRINGDLHMRWPGNINLSFTDSLPTLKDLAISSDSACASGSAEPSYVLSALGVSPDLIKQSIRIGIGKYTTKDELDYVLRLLRFECGRIA